MNLIFGSTATIVFCILWAAKTSAAPATEESTLKQLEPEVSTENNNLVDKEKHENNDEPADNDDEQKNPESDTSNSTESNSNSTESAGGGKAKLGCALVRPAVKIVNRSYQQVIRRPPPPMRIVEKVYIPIQAPAQVEYVYPRSPCIACEQARYIEPPRPKPCQGGCGNSGYFKSSNQVEYQRPSNEIHYQKFENNINYQQPEYQVNNQRSNRGA